MENDNFEKKIASVLFLYNEPINISKIKELTGISDISDEEMANILGKIKTKLNELGLTLTSTDVGKIGKAEFSIVSSPEMIEVAKAIRKDELDGELTPASLQVLTICAYLGNPTKNEISFIRGVQSAQSIRSLSSRGLIKRDGERYSISTEAMQALSITKVSDLPEYEAIKKDFEERLREVLKDEKSSD